MSNQQISVPASPEGIDATWLGEALATRYPGTGVEGLTVDRTIHGSGTKLRLLLEYNDAGQAHGLPSTMWLKGGWEPYSAMARDSYVTERRFYEWIREDRVVNSPYCYFGTTDPQSGLTAILMEDLLARDVRFGDVAQPLDPEAARRALDSLARLHAHSWSAAELAELSVCGDFVGEDGIIFRLIDKQGWDACVAGPRGARVPDPLRSREGIRRAYARMWELDAASELCVVHGDPHPSNLFFEPDGAAGFYDFQRVMRSDWSHDVAYLLIGSLSEEDCAENEQDLLAYYLERRVARGSPEIPFDQALLAYRRHATHGLVFVINPDALQPPEVNEALAHRFGAAATRLDTWGALFD